MANHKGFTFVVACMFALATLSACGGGGGGGGGGGSTATNPILATPSAVLADFASPNTGGIGRIGRTDVDGIAGDGNYQLDDKSAIVAIVSSSGISGLLADPTTTNLLMEDSTINYNGDRGRPTIKPADPSAPTQPPAPVQFDIGNRTTGTIHHPLLDNGDTAKFRVYIDNHAAVVLSFRPDTDMDPDPVQFVAIGEPVSNLPTTGTAQYSGLTRIVRLEPAAHRNAGTGFAMEVNFDTNAVTRFVSDFGGFNGEVSASENLPIDMTTGTFGGAIALNRGASGAPDSIIPADTTGMLYGQFHGNEATGVTGGFHSMNNEILGAFAGSKETTR